MRTGSKTPTVSFSPESHGGFTALTVPREKIAARAYELYLQRGATNGHDMEDWLRAERDLEGDIVVPLF